jgi:hypothetical protein
MVGIRGLGWPGILAGSSRFVTRFGRLGRPERADEGRKAAFIVGLAGKKSAVVVASQIDESLWLARGLEQLPA